MAKIQGPMPYADPRVRNNERFDQRYDNYTYGDDPDFAVEQQDALAKRGEYARDDYEQYYAEESRRDADNVDRRTTPVTDYTAANATIDQQGDLSNRLTAFAEQGPGPSRAQADLQANTAQGLRQQLMMAGSGRGAGGQANAYRTAGMNQAIMQGAANARATRQAGASEGDQALGALSTALPLMAMISDRRAKKNIRRDDDLNDRYAALMEHS